LLALRVGMGGAVRQEDGRARPRLAVKLRAERSRVAAGELAIQSCASRASIILGPSKRRFVNDKITFFLILIKILHANFIAQLGIFSIF